jgi:hypothetical protein
MGFMQATNSPEHISPDGLWRWDGMRWTPTGVAAATPVHAAQEATTGARRSRLGILGGAIAVLGLPAILAACIVPYIYWSDTSNGATSSVFDLGNQSGLWYAAEPVAVMTFGLAAAILLMAWPNRVARAVTAGLLVAFGLQTVTMFLGYAFGDLSFGRMGPAGPIGAVGGLLVFAGGALGVGSLFMRDP